jgi:prolyl-tRNA editing enzyme YbaK/EbsC (Cys-tRNA(Pro) deacylase)
MVGSMNDVVVETADATGQPFEIVPCDPELADTAAFCEAYGYGLDQSANAIVVVGKGDPRIYVCCLVLATTRLDVNGVVRKRLGRKKASFASADETAELTGMQIGGVTPYGLAAGLPIWIDGAIMKVPQVIVSRRWRRQCMALLRPRTSDPRRRPEHPADGSFPSSIDSEGRKT